MGRLETLASDIEKSNFQGGISGELDEFFKNQLGTQDDVTNLKTEFFKIRASQAVKNLPPGSASDVDVALALQGFPNQKANKDQVASFLRGVSKLELVNQSFNDFKSDLISRTKGTKGLIQKWRTKITSPRIREHFPKEDFTVGDLWMTAAEDNLTIEEVKERLGIE